MNLYDEVYRIKELRCAIRDKLISMNLLGNNAIYEQGQADERAVSGGDLDACTTAICSIDGSINVTNTSRVYVGDKKQAQVVDSNLIPGNIRNGVTILGVTGNFVGTNYSLPLTASYTWNYGASGAPTTINHPSDSSGYKKVYTQLNNGSSYTLKPENIVKGVRIMGVTGTYDLNSMKAGHVGGQQTPHQNTSIQFLLTYCGSNAAISYNDITANDIQTGWVMIYPTPDGASDNPGWNPPDRTYYYIYRVTFGRNKYENNVKFLSLDVCQRDSMSADDVYHIRVDGAAPYTISSLNGQALLTIDLTGKEFRLANWHEEYGAYVDWSDKVRFDTARRYHIDVRW